MNEWFIPRAFAVATVVIVGIGVWDAAYRHLWWSIPFYIVSAGLAAWISHSMCDAIRERHWNEHAQRRRVRVWLPTTSANVLEVVLPSAAWPAGGWDIEAAPGYEGDARRLAEQR